MYSGPSSSPMSSTVSVPLVVEWPEVVPFTDTCNAAVPTFLSVTLCHSLTGSSVAASI